MNASHLSGLLVENISDYVYGNNTLVRINNKYNAKYNLVLHKL